MRVRVSHRSRKPRKDSKTNALWGSTERGDGQDNGKYFRCWNCDFICDKDRDELGDSQSVSKVTPTTYTLKDQYGDTAYRCIGAHGDDQTTCEARGGTWSSVGYYPVVDAGCPFCGTLNWRGDY